MPDELKKREQLIQNDEDVLFDEYINRSRFGSKFWLSVTMAVVFILAVVVYKVAVLDRIIPPEILKNSIKIFDIDSQWVVKEEVHEKDFDGIILVPQISFRFRNVGETDLKFVHVLGIFRLLNRAKALGEDSRLALKEPLKPGGESERIVLTCNFGYRATSREAFARNPKQWKSASAEIYVQTGGSKLIFINTYYIIRKIQGLDSEIEIKMT